MSEEPKLEELDRLISMGKQKGFLTYDEVNDALPSDIVSLDQLDDIMMMFGAMDIEVVDSAKAAPPAVRGGAARAGGGRRRRPADAIDLTPGPVGRTEDPVRLYLREMGRVSLLTREGEIALAKRIEEGKEQVTRAILSTNLALERFRELRDQLRRSEISVKEVVDVNEEEFTEEKEAALTRQVGHRASPRSTGSCASATSSSTKRPGSCRLRRRQEEGARARSRRGRSMEGRPRSARTRSSTSCASSTSATRSSIARTGSCAGAASCSGCATSWTTSSAPSA